MRAAGLRLGEWAAKRPAFDLQGVPGFAGISGGRTSAMMAAMLDPSIALCFQNTGREHPNTLVFLDRLQHAIGREIVWLEWRPAPKKGDPPRLFGFERVTYETAARKGEPFRDMLEALRDYRATKGEGPIAPWARSRLCTAYLKHRVMDRYVSSLGVDAFDTFLGLRYDEPERVSRLGVSRESHDKGRRVPLFDAKIVKADVLAFWRGQAFDLELEDHQGNCTGCFLKDQADLARVLAEPETDAAWWLAIENDFPDFGGRRFPGYRQLASELPARRAAAEAFASGRRPPQEAHGLDPIRHRLVVRQEARRAAGERGAFACDCEGAAALAEEEAS